jgi:hypothetical protein
MKKRERPIAKQSKSLEWLHGEVKSPPFSLAVRLHTGDLIRKLQNGEMLPTPLDETLAWRIMYRIDADAIVILEVFRKKSPETPKPVIDVCKARLKRYEDESE